MYIPLSRSAEGLFVMPVNSGPREERKVDDDTMRKKIDFVLRSLKIFKKQPDENSQYTFEIVKTIATNCLPEFIKYTMDHLCVDPHRDINSKELVTSSSNTFCSISSLFIGIKKAKEMMELMDVEPKYLFTLTFPDSSTFAFETVQLFAGNALNIVMNEPNFESLPVTQKTKRLYELVLPKLQEFHQMIQNSVSICFKTNCYNDKIMTQYVLGILKKSRYHLNLSVINSLRQEIQTEAAKVTSNKSFLYCVTTKTPFIRGKLKSKLEHAFLLVQYLNHKDQTVRYRRYQSWDDYVTVKEDLSRFQFNNKGEESWDSERKDKFLEQLENYYCSNTEFLEPAKAYQCFGYHHNTREEFPLLISHQKTIAGVSVRYFAHEFNPNECLQHLQETISQNK